MIDPLAHKVRARKYRRKKKAPLSEEVRQITKALTVTLAILILGSTGAYLAINSQRAAKGYELEKLRQSYESTAAEGRQLDHQVIQAQSFSKLELQKESEMDTQKDIRFTYINPDSNVAQSPTSP